MDEIKDQNQSVTELVEDRGDLAGLIEMIKDGIILFVDPAAIDAHRALGWKEKKSGK